MINTTRKRMTKLETVIIIIVCVLFSAMGIMSALYRAPGEYIEITVEGKHYRTIDLRQVLNEYDLHIQTDYPVTLHVTREGVSFIHSQCPDKLCEGFGCVPKDSSSAVCLPAKVVVRSSEQSIVTGKGENLYCIAKAEKLR